MWIMGPHIYHQEEHVKKCSLLAVSAKATNRAAASQWDIHPLIIKIKLPKKLKTLPSVPCPSVCNLGFVIYGQWPHDFGCLLNNVPHTSKGFV
jgi:hypothetical protein